MRRIPVLLFLCVGFATVGAVGQVAGFTHSEVVIDIGAPGIDGLEFNCDLGFEGALDNWTLGGLINLEDTGLERLAFLARGSIGAFNIYSLYQVEALDGGTPIPDDNILSAWDNAVWTTIVGADLWAFFSNVQEDWLGATLIGTGISIGAHAFAGDVEICGEVTSNLSPMLPYIYWNGLEKVVERNLACDLIQVLNPTSDFGFELAEFAFDFPCRCADISSWISFSTQGFNGLAVEILDFASGLPGLTVEAFGIFFLPEEKFTVLELGLDPVTGLCITPYVTLAFDALTTPTGLQVDALELDYSIGDVSVVVSELLADDDYYIGVDCAIHEYPWLSMDLAFPDECVDPVHGVEEAIGIEVGQSGCCGGESFVGIYNYFDIDLSDALFDWLGARVRTEFGLSTCLSVFAEAVVWHDEYDTITFGFDCTCGILSGLTADRACGIPMP